MNEWSGLMDVIFVKGRGVEARRSERYVFCYNARFCVATNMPGSKGKIVA